MARRSEAGKEIHLRSITLRLVHNKEVSRGEDTITAQSFNAACIEMYTKFVNDEWARRLDIFRVLKDGKLKCLMSHTKIGVRG